MFCLVYVFVLIGRIFPVAFKNRPEMFVLYCMYIWQFWDCSYPNNNIIWLFNRHHFGDSDESEDGGQLHWQSKG